MRYVLSDIHGCYDQYYELLFEKIGITEDDQVYILGDAIDRGPEPIKVLQDIMSRDNFTYLMGNHDFVALNLMQKIFIAHTAQAATKEALENQIEEYLLKSLNGETVTITQFRFLEPEEQREIMDFLLDAYVYLELEQGDKRYLLVHAGIEDFDPDKPLDEYEPDYFLFDRPDFKKPYFKDENIQVIVGHTPTPLIREDKMPLVYKENGFIAIDCGCVFGGRLAAFCLETEEVIYVDGQNRKPYSKQED